jgi:hypothetical protein
VKTATFDTPTSLASWPARLAFTLLAFALVVVPLGGADGNTTTRAPVVELPPFIVSGNKEQFVHYIETPDFRILSSCSRVVTVDFAESYLLVQHMLETVLPRKFRLSTAVPETIILVNEKHNRVAAEITDEMLRAEDIRQSNAIVSGTRFLPNLRYSERDSTTTFTVVRELEFDPAHLTIATDYLHFLLEERSPSLPRWFVEGMLTVFRDGVLLRDGLKLRQVTWVSPEITRQLQEREPAEATVGGLIAHLTSAKALLLSFDEFFAEPSALTTSEKDRVREIRRCQAAILIRLALDYPEWNEKLHRLVERSMEGKISEADFVECMGMNYGRVREILEKYLNALTKVKVLHRVAPRAPRPIPRINVRAPTEAEVARIRGDWERRLVGYVQLRFPHHAEKYAAQARRTLTKAYAKGLRDPELLATLGLLECQQGDDAAARPYLEAAVKSQVIRPSAYVELARIRWDARVRASSTGAASLSEAEVRALMEILQTAREQAPPLVENYRLVARAWASTDTQPSAADLALLKEGTRFFPADVELLYATARVYVAHNFKREAGVAIERGERLETASVRFMALKERLNRSAPQN